MQRLAALLLWLTTVQVAWAALGTPSLAPFWDYKNFDALATPADYGVHGPSGQTESVCMRVTDYCMNTQCDTGPGPECHPFHYTLDMACMGCHPGDSTTPDGRNVEDLLSKSRNVAKCVVFEAMSGKLDLPDQPGVKIQGTFTASCVIKDGAGESCGHPGLCDDVIAQISGVHYWIDQAVRVGPEHDWGYCAGDKRMAGEHPNGPATKANATRGAAAAYDGEYGDLATPPSGMVDVGLGRVYLGSMTVFSRRHAVSYDKGWMQISLVFGSTSTPAAQTANLPHIHDGQAVFTFTKDKAPY